MQIPHWPESFLFFFLLAMVIGVVGVYIAGRRLSEEPLRWSLMIVLSIAGWILGSKLYFMPAQGWEALYSGAGTPHVTGMSLLGGVLGGVFFVVILRVATGTRGREGEVWAIMAPLTVLVGRLGCLFAGCCHGTQTSLWWGVSYPPGTVPFNTQVREGLLSAEAQSSLPIHPAQAYEILFLTLLTFLIVRLRNRFRNRNSLILVMLALYCAFRFGQEFVRYGGGELGGLKPVQWGLIAFFSFFAMATLLLEKGIGVRRLLQRGSNMHRGTVRTDEEHQGAPQPKMEDSDRWRHWPHQNFLSTPASVVSAEPPCSSHQEQRFGPRLVVAAAATVLMMVALYRWCSPIERTALLVASVPLAAHLAHALAKALIPRLETAPLWLRRVVSPPAATGAALAALAFAAPNTTNSPSDKKNRDSIVFDVSGGGGSYRYTPMCNDTEFVDNYGAGQIGVAWRQRLQGGRFMFQTGLRGYLSQVTREEGDDADPEREFEHSLLNPPMFEQEAPATYWITGAELYVLSDFHWAAVALGAHVSQHSFSDGLQLFPSFYVRGGPEDIAFGEISLFHGDYPPMASPWYAGAGVAAGDYLTIRAGLGFAGIMVQPTLRLPLDGLRLNITPFAMFMMEEMFGSEGQSFFGLSVGLELPLEK